MTEIQKQDNQPEKKEVAPKIDEKTSTGVTLTDAKKRVSSVIDSIKKSILEGKGSPDELRKKYELVMKTIATKLGLKENDTFSEDALTKDMLEKVDTDQEIQALVQETLKVLADTSLDEKKILDYAQKSFQYKEVVEGKFTSKAEVVTTIKNAMNFESSLQSNNGVNKMITEVYAKAPEKNVFENIGDSFARLFQLPVSLSDAQGVQFMGCFNKQTFEALGTWSEKNGNYDKFRNPGAALQSMYGEMFEDQGDRSLFARVMQNEGKKVLGKVMDYVGNVTEKEKLVTQFDDLKKLYATISDPASLTPNVKKQLQEAGIDTSAVALNKTMLDVKKSIDTYEGIITIIDGFKDFDANTVTQIKAMIAKADGNEAASYIFFNAVSIMRNMGKWMNGLPNALGDAATQISGKYGQQALQPFLQLVQKEPWQIFQIAINPTALATTLSALGVGEFPVQGVMDILLQTLLPALGVEAAKHFLTNILPGIGQAGSAMMLAGTSVELTGMVTGLLHKYLFDDTRKGHEMEFTQDIIKKNTNTNKVEVKKVNYLETSTPDEFLNFTAREALKNITEKYMYTQVVKGGVEMSAYKAAGFEKTERGGRTAFNKAIIFNVAKELGADTKELSEKMKKLTTNASFGDADFIESGKFVQSIKELTKITEITPAMRDKILLSLNAMIEKAASQNTNFAGLDVKTDKKWVQKKLTTENFNKQFVLETGKVEQTDAIADADLETKLMKDHELAVAEMESLSKTIGLNTLMTPDESKLVGLLATLRNPNFNKNMNQEQIAHALSKAGKIFVSLYAKLHEKSREDGMQKYFEAYGKVRKVEQSFFKTDNALTERKKAETDAFVFVSILSPVELGELIQKNEQFTFDQGWRAVNKALVVLEDVGTISKGYADIFGKKAATEKVGEQDGKKKEEVLVGGEEIQGKKYTKEQYQEPLDDYEKQKLGEFLKSKGITSEHLLIDPSLSKGEYAKILKWPDPVLKCAADAGVFKNGSTTGMLKGGERMLDSKTVETISLFKDQLADTAKFQAFSLYGVYGNAQYQKQYIENRAKGQVMENVSIAKVSQTPSGFLNQMLTDKSYEEAQVHFLTSSTYYEEHTGVKIEDMFHKAATEDKDTLARFSEKILQDAQATYNDQQSTPSKEKEDLLKTSLGIFSLVQTISTQPTILKDPLSLMGQVSVSNVRNDFQIIGNIGAVIKDRLEKIFPNNEGKKIAKAMREKDLRTVYYRQYLGKEMPQQETLKDRKELLKKLLDKTFGVVNLVSEERFKNISNDASECLNEFQKAPWDFPKVYDPD